jgi:hypothetical protein
MAGFILSETQACSTAPTHALSSEKRAFILEYSIIPSAPVAFAFRKIILINFI